MSKNKCRFCLSENLTVPLDFDERLQLIRCESCQGVFSEFLGEEPVLNQYNKLYRPGDQYQAYREELDMLQKGNNPRLGWNRALFLSSLRKGPAWEKACSKLDVALVRLPRHVRTSTFVTKDTMLRQRLSQNATASRACRCSRADGGRQ